LHRSALLLPALAIIVIAAVAANSACASAGAAALLHPTRHHVTKSAPAGCDDVTLSGAGVRLKGWRCKATAARRGTIVYLHGVADNRASAVGVIQKFTARGFDVIAYDSRAHGESEGDACTYGFFEKDDLHHVLDTIEPGPIVLIGTSLGAAVALQEAADDRRVTTVIAAETFSDLRTIATERAPFFFTAGTIRKAFQLAAEQARFDVDAVSPRLAAARVDAPVFLIHGAEDTDTPPEHSRRVYAALHEPKRLVIVPNAGHNGSLRADVWRQIDDWIDRFVPQKAPVSPR
jgi:pimeloyl-ACP methyl ester carboxylesterase